MVQGQVFNHITWDVDFYKAIDFSSSMCEFIQKVKILKLNVLTLIHKSFRRDKK